VEGRERERMRIGETWEPGLIGRRLMTIWSPLFYTGEETEAQAQRGEVSCN
jgi:hypothetical protein